MIPNEWNDAMDGAIADLSGALMAYADAYNAGLDRTEAGQKLARAYYALCSVDNGIAKNGSQAGNE